MGRKPWALGPEHRGLPLEDRRQARVELMARYLRDNPKAAREAKQFVNTVAQYDPATMRSKVVDRYASDYARVVGAVEKEQYVTPVNAPPVVRRGRAARLDAMIERLKSLPPELLEAKLTEIEGEFWKLGMPVAREDLKRVAAQYLNRRGVDKHYSQPIRGTRT